MNTEQTIDFNFTYFALKALGNSLYSNPWTAVSELVANGLDAGATEVKVLIDIRDKTHATIEIVDNGSGMTYSDIADKYAIIGRNRREENPQEKTFGRKGVGKLAALYLTSHYYIITKTQGDCAAWEIDTALFKDSDIPKLRKIDNQSVPVTADSEWKKVRQGTLIKLVDVNLNLIGEKKIESLKAILADYYLPEIYGNAISVAVLKNDNEGVSFQNIEKNIYFDAFYGLFDTTKKNVKKLRSTVYLTDEDEVFPEIDYPRETVVVSNTLPCTGIIEMENEKGSLIEVPYDLQGWIGINCSLRPEIQKRNSPNYVRLPYRSNELRLYVNGKLAVADMMKYIGSTQVNANYIEGELSFDVLDRSDLEDAATSSRESYKMEDMRVQKLIEIISPIVSKLIVARSSIGTQINEQQKQLYDAKQKQLENEQKKTEDISNALKKIETEKKDVERANAVAAKRLFVLERNFIGSGENYKNGMHLAVNYAKAIKSTAIKLSKYAQPKNIVHLIDIAGYSENIIRLNKMLGKAKFSLDSPEIEENLFGFIRDYIKIINTSSLECICDFAEKQYVVEFDFCEMSMALENILSNSKKAKAKKLYIRSFKEGDSLFLEFRDDGHGLDPSIKNVDEIFELGFTTTNGYGIGCYYINKTFSKVATKISAREDNGFVLTMELK